MADAFFFDVLDPILHPVAARAGDVIVVRPGTPIPVAVMRRVGTSWRLVRKGPPNYGALLHPLLDGAISAQTRDAASWLWAS